MSDPSLLDKRNAFEIGKRAMGMRIARRYSMATLSLRTGLPVLFVEMLEAGIYALVPNEAEVTLLADALGVRRDWLATGTGPIEPRDLRLVKDRK